MPLQLPSSYESLTPEWLTAAICAQHEDVSILDYRLGPPDNASTNRRKIFLEYSEKRRPAELPDVLFCKATHDPESRRLASVFGNALSETFFYSQIRPHLPIEAPESLFSQFDSESFNSMLMLADLSSRVSEFCDYGTQMTRERITGQLAVLATLHGTCYRASQIQSQLKSLQSWPSFFHMFASHGLKTGSEAGFLNAADAIPPRLHRRFKNIWPAVVASVERHDQLPRTLIHGDAHPKNWYVAQNGRMGLCDWQSCSLGHWSRDVAHVMSALTIEDRRAWESELLRLYVELLELAGGPPISIDEAWTNYRQQMMSVLVWWTVTCSRPPSVPTVEPENRLMEYVRRVATAVDDLQSLDSF